MSYINNPWLILSSQIFEGIGVSLSWAAQVEYKYYIFPAAVKISAITIIYYAFCRCRLDCKYDRRNFLS